MSMTFDLLQGIQRVIDEKIDALHAEWHEKERQYIQEHAPLKIEHGDMITIKLQVVEGSLKNVREKFLSWPRYQLGHIYYKRGEFCGWFIHPKTGECRPMLKFCNTSLEDKIVSIKRTRGK